MMFIVPVMFNLPKSAELTITVVIGGMGSLTGSILGALVVTLLPELFRGFANYRMFFYGIAVVAIIILKPDGLLGYKEFSPTGIVRTCRSVRFIKHRCARFAKDGCRQGDDVP
jgi:branched-chain amino acid transport system permease protein